MHVPGIKVVMPATASDAKGLLYSSVIDMNPVLYIDDRWCYDHEEEVPEDLEEIPIGKAKVEKKGKDVTILAVSYMLHEAFRAEKELSKKGIDAEIINLRTVKPWDYETIAESVKKTGHLIIADTGWVEGGIGAEISSKLTGNLFNFLKKPIIRVGLPNIPAPCSRTLEEAYYPKSTTIIEAVDLCLGKKTLRTDFIPTPKIPGNISY